MKKIFSTIIPLLLFVANINAQTYASDSAAINNFIKELHGLNSDYVNTIRSDSKTMLDDIMRQAQMRYGDNFDNVMFSGLGEIWEDGYYQLSFISDNATGHKIMLDFIERYNVAYSDELFGVPLVTAMREDFEEQYLFSDYNNTFIFHVSDYEVSIVYANYPLLELLSNLVRMLMLSVDGNAMIDVETLLQGNVALYLTIEDLSFRQMIGSPEHPTTISDVKPVTNYETVVFAGENRGFVFNEPSAQLHDAETQRLHDAISKLEYPAFLENKTAGKHLVAIPRVPEEWAGECEPYALSNIYDWINEIGFGSGVNSVHRKSAIITPRDVLSQYAIEYLAGKDTTFAGYPDELKKVYAAEYQGGTPAVLYSKSLTTDGYNDMMNDLRRIFNTPMGENYKNLKVTQRVARNGYRYVQLYGDAGVLVYMMESSEEKYCQIFITIGAEAFTHAVNACTMGGETNIADNYSITISENGISFQPCYLQLQLSRGKDAEPLCIDGAAGNDALSFGAERGVHIVSNYLEKILGK